MAPNPPPSQRRRLCRQVALRCRDLLAPFDTLYGMTLQHTHLPKPESTVLNGWAQNIGTWSLGNHTADIYIFLDGIHLATTGGDPQHMLSSQGYRFWFGFFTDNPKTLKVLEDIARKVFGTSTTPYHDSAARKDISAFVLQEYLAETYTNKRSKGGHEYYLGQWDRAWSINDVDIAAGAKFIRDMVWGHVATPLTGTPMTRP